MESGFGQNLEGFLIKGNLSLAPAANPTLQGDGSIEGSGTLYFDNIREYNNSNGINIQDIILKNGKIVIPYTIPSSITDASLIINGGITINHTQNATSTSAGGGLTVAGGASIKKDLVVCGILNVSGNFINNVKTPVLGSDAVNKDYVDLIATKVSGNFSTGQVIIADSNGDSIIGYNFFTTDTNELYLTIPFSINSSLTVFQNINAKQDILVEGLINLLGNSIINVANPINNLDAVNKEYVDTLISNISGISGNFTSGQVLVGSTLNGISGISGYDNFVYDGLTLTLNNTISNAFICNGNAVFNKNVFVGGSLDLDGNNIINIADPINNLDAVNKEYLVNYVNSHISTNGNLNITAGQFVIGDLNNNITSYSNIKYDYIKNNIEFNSTFYITDTTNSSGLNTNGSLVTLGGARIEKDLFIGGILDTNLNNIKNVADPIDPLDAVNKEYLDNAISNINLSNVSGYILNNNTTLPTDISTLYYPETVEAFITNISVYNNTFSSLYTVYGFNINGNWEITTSYVGQPLNISFYIKNENGYGVLQYTNKNTTGTSYITFKTTCQINTYETNFQQNTVILNNIINFTNVPSFKINCNVTG